MALWQGSQSHVVVAPEMFNRGRCWALKTLCKEMFWSFLQGFFLTFTMSFYGRDYVVVSNRKLGCIGVHRVEHSFFFYKGVEHS
jgi:hypothetical protein